MPGGKEEIVKELVTSARKLLEEGRIASAVLLIKDALNMMGQQEKARTLEETVVRGVKVDAEYVWDLIEGMEGMLSKGREGVKGAARQAIPGKVKLLLTTASILLILVLLKTLPPVGDAIAIPLATLLLIIAADHATLESEGSGNRHNTQAQGKLCTSEAKVREGCSG